MKRIEQAVILATDIRGFTSLCEKINLPRAGRFIDEYFSIVRNSLEKVAEKNEIVINRFLGDGFLIFIFDYEKGSSKAIKASFDIRNNLKKKIRDELKFTGAGISIAINKGIILYGDFGQECSQDSSVCPSDWVGEKTAIGPEINKTFRMLSIASKDQILISNEVRNDIRENHIWTELDSTQVKGIKEPLIPFLILREGSWQEQRFCGSCKFCDNHEYCTKAYYFGRENVRPSFYVEKKWELHKQLLCDERIEGKGKWCKGCKINILSTKEVDKGCLSNYMKGLSGKLEERFCCSDCERYFTCQFNLHRGKNHIPKEGFQEQRKRYCCEECKYFTEPESVCLNERMYSKEG